MPRWVWKEATKLDRALKLAQFTQPSRLDRLQAKATRCFPNLPDVGDEGMTHTSPERERRDSLLAGQPAASSIVAA